MFTDSEIKRAHLIAKKWSGPVKRADFLENKAVGAAAGGFGRLEGNPNTMAMEWPRYNEPAPAFAAPRGPRTFMQSMGDMGRGAYRSGMGLATATTIGQNGSNGMAVNGVMGVGQSIRDMGRGYWNAGKAVAGGQGWTGANRALGQMSSNLGQDWKGTVSGPFNRFRDNNYQDIQNLNAPRTWWKQPWLPEWRGYGSK
jgi:hypothetical protein